MKEIDQVQQTGEPLIVMKRGKPIVKKLTILTRDTKILNYAKEKHVKALEV